MIAGAKTEGSDLPACFVGAASNRGRDLLHPTAQEHLALELVDVLRPAVQVVFDPFAVGRVHLFEFAVALEMSKVSRAKPLRDATPERLPQFVTLLSMKGRLMNLKSTSISLRRAAKPVALRHLHAGVDGSWARAGLQLAARAARGRRSLCDESGPGGLARGRERFADGGFSGGSLDRPALQRLLTAMDGSSLDQIAVREGCTTRHVAKTIPLAFLAPDLVQALIEARLPRGFSTKRIGAPELEWARQWERLGCAAESAFASCQIGPVIPRVVPPIPAAGSAESTQSANPSPVAGQEPRFWRRRRPGEVALQARCLCTETAECAGTTA